MEYPIESQLKSLERLSLEDISLRRMAVLLCSNSFKFMSPFVNVCGERKKAARIEVFTKIVTELCLPQSMTEPLVDIMNFVFVEINKWFTFHEDFYKPKDSSLFCPKYIKHLHWTHMGTVNYRKTAEAIIHDKKLNINLRFHLACLYCLHEDIQDLWQKLTPRSRKCFYNNGQPGRHGPTEIVVFWICILKGRMDQLQDFLLREERYYSSLYQYAFETFASKGYEAATQFFFEKLTGENKNALLMKMVNVIAAYDDPTFLSHTDVFSYLLSQMNSEQLQSVLEHSPYSIIRSFLEWPRQNIFSEVAKLALPYLQENDYGQLHFLLSRKLRYLYNSPKLFRDVFLITPRAFRRNSYYLKDIIRRNDTKSIQFMFRHMDREETLELVTSGISLHLCYELVKGRKWNFLEFYIRESRLCREEIDRLVFEINSKYSKFIDLESREYFIKLVDNIFVDTANNDFSNSSEVNQMDPMDFQSTGQPDEELIEQPAKKIKKF